MFKILFHSILFLFVFELILSKDFELICRAPHYSIEECEVLVIAAVCLKDCGLHNQNSDIITLFACLVERLNSSPVKIKQKN